MARSRGVSAGKVLLLVTSALVFGDLIALTFVRAHPATAVKSSPSVASAALSSSNPNSGANAAKVGATPAVAASTSSKGTSTSQNNKPAAASVPPSVGSVLPSNPSAGLTQQSSKSTGVKPAPVSSNPNPSSSSSVKAKTSSGGSGAVATSQSNNDNKQGNGSKTMDPAFEGAGQEAGLKVWRIENFEAVPFDKVGQFYTGDSYIVLHTVENNGKFSWDIHFWLGTETSQDEMGTAAIKAVELDDQLGGVPVQFREVQGSESSKFLSYFKKGIRYLPGGVKSGFTHVDPDSHEKRLFHVKGRRNVRVKQIPLDISQMNKGDCFILDVGKDIYVWAGPDSRKIERLKAVMVANEIRDEDHAGNARVHVIDEAAPQLTGTFFEELGGGGPGDVPDASGNDEDAQFERTEGMTVALSKISDAGGSLSVVKVGEKPLTQEMLGTGDSESQDAYILETGAAVIYVWVGKGSSKDEKVHAMTLASKYIAEKGYPKGTKVERVVEGGEPAVFKQYFKTWKELESTVGLGRVFTKRQIAAVAAGRPERDFDVSNLHAEKRRLLAKNAGKAFGFMPDDGSGSIEIWRIENFDMVPVEAEKTGMFFGGDSYVIKYTYQTEGREKYIVYFWQGKESTQDEKAASAINAVKLDNDLNGKAIQVRVVQGEEPSHFLHIFKGKMITFMGGKASGFKNVRDHDTYDADGTRLFRVRGTSDVDIRAEQMPEVAASLASDDVFILETPSDTYIWAGTGASDDEKSMAKNIAGIVSPDKDAQLVAEGEEHDGFWNGLGGKGDYNTSVGLPQGPLLEPRLFHCILTAAGKLRVEEVEGIDQGDLNVDDAMVLDTGDEVYVWVGEGATAEEKDKAFAMAEEYIKTDPTERSLDNTVIFAVKQGLEPEAFTSVFPSWDDAFWNNQQTMEDIRSELEARNATIE